MNITKFLAAAAFAIIGSAASATTVTAVQGLASDGSAVAPDRSIVASANDGNLATFYSLGIGGTLSIDVSPAVLESASVIEVTFGTPNPAFPESAQILLGGSVAGGVYDSTGSTLLGEIFNDGSFTNALGTITMSAIGANGASFSIDIPSIPAFSLITLLDTTIANFAGSYDPSKKVSDGFDVSEFTVAAVPLPAGVVLLLSGMAGFAAVRRRAA